MTPTVPICQPVTSIENEEITDSDFHALPPSMQDIAKLVGMPATLGIIKCRGGIRLCVPKKASIDHWLVPIIGAESLAKLSNYFGGEEIQIPRCTKLIQRMVTRAIKKDAAKGLSQTQLAMKYGYTERWIIEILKRDQRQQEG